MHVVSINKAMNFKLNQRFIRLFINNLSRLWKPKYINF